MLIQVSKMSVDVVIISSVFSALHVDLSLPPSPSLRVASILLHAGY